MKMTDCTNGRSVMLPDGAILSSIQNPRILKMPKKMR